MQNPISLFRSMLQWFRPTRRSLGEQPTNNSSPAKEQAVEAISPEKFREMFAAMLADRETRGAIMRSLIANFPIQGGTCTSATLISSGDFGSGCTPAGNFTFSTSSVGIGTLTPLGALDVVGPAGASAWTYFRGNCNGVNPSASFNGGGFAIGWNRSGSHGESNLVFNTKLGTAPGLEIGEWDGTTYVADMIVKQGGNVGIGTTAPGAQLDVQNPTTASNIAIRATNANGTIMLIPNSGAGAYNNLVQAGDQALIFYGTAGNAGNLVIGPWSGTGSPGIRMTIAGNVGIGNANPQAALDITGGMNASGSAVLGGTATKQSVNGPEKLSVQDASATKVAIGAFVGSELNARFLLDMNGNHEWSSDGNDQTVVLGCIDKGRMNLAGFPKGANAGGGLGIVAWKSSYLTAPVLNTTVTTFSVHDATPFTGVTRIRVENEICQLNSIVGTTLNVTRGYQGTAAASHVVNTPVVAIGTEEAQPRILFLNDGGGIAFSDGISATDVSLSRPSANQILLQGNLATGRANITLSNGDNGDVGLLGATFVKVTGPTMPFAVTGFAGGSDGRILLLYNTTSQTMTIKNNIGSLAANRILTLTGADVPLRAGQSFATFIYDVDQALWILTSTN